MREKCPHCGYELPDKDDPTSTDADGQDECPRCGTRVSEYLALYGGDDASSPVTAPADPGSPPPAVPTAKRSKRGKGAATAQPGRSSVTSRHLVLLGILAIVAGLWVAWNTNWTAGNGQTAATNHAPGLAEPVDACNVAFEVGCIEAPETSASTEQAASSAQHWSNSIELRRKGLCGTELLSAVKTATGVGLDWQAADLLMLERILPTEHVKPMQDQWIALWKREVSGGAPLMGERIGLGSRLSELMAQTGETEASAKVPDDEYFQLRNYLFSATKQAMKVQQAFGIDEVWAAVMEITYPDHSMTLAALADGDAAVWLGTGGGKLAECGNLVTRRAAVRFVEQASHSIKLMEPHLPTQPNEELAEEFGEFKPIASRFPLPERGNARIYVMSRVGLHRIEAPQAEMDAGTHALSPLFRLGLDVIETFED